MWNRLLGAMLAGLVWLTAAPGAVAASQSDYREDAGSIEPLINAQYAYLDRFPGGRFVLTDKLRAEADTVSDRRSLVKYAERVLELLADHHAITGASFADSWAIVPSYADLWIEPRGAAFVVTAVRDGSPAARADVRPGDVLTAVDGTPTAQAVAAFWADLGTSADGDDRPGYAARVLAAGRRDRHRRLTLRRGNGPERTIDLPSLYDGAGALPLVSTSAEHGALVIRLGDSLGDHATIAAFDAAMKTAAPGQPVVIDLTATPSGGDTVVARAIMGWFARRATGYQVHNSPAEERETGIPRQWIEQVLPRRGLHHDGPLLVRVGRWTGSMGEGLAIGLRALGARVEGGRMAGLRGAVDDEALPHTGEVLKLPTERLYTVDGIPREAFTPKRPGP